MRARSVRIFVPVGRPHLEDLKTEPHLLHLYFVLADRCDKARHEQENHDGSQFYRDYVFERIEPHTYICNLSDLAAELQIRVQELMKRLRALYKADCLECLVFVTQACEPEDEDTAYHEIPANITSYGYPLSTFVEGGTSYEGDEWFPDCFIRVARYRLNKKQTLVRVPFIQVPQSAVELSDKHLRFLLYIYSKARFNRKERIYNNQSYCLQPGELVASYREIARELDEHHEQIKRWAKRAESLELLRKIPTSQNDALWRIALAGRASPVEKSPEPREPTW